MIKIGERQIGLSHPPFIIAEMSGNHNQSLEKALQMVEVAAKAGADALKIQTYRAETMTLNHQGQQFTIQDSKSLWNKETLYSLYQKAYTPWEWHEAIFNKCMEEGIIGFSSPFDATAIDFLESLNVPCYKIASFECTDLPLIRKVASTKKPIIISTGMCTVAEIDEAVQTAIEAGCEQIILLKCTSTYPATPKTTNVRTIPHMRELWNCEIGLSDHTMGNGVAIASIALGAVVIEKHLTLSREDGGVDAAFSAEPDELATLVKESKRAWQGLGNIYYGPTQEEKSSLQFRRSLYISEDMKKGEILTEKNLRVVRPGYGLPPKYYDMLLGKKVNQTLKKGTPFHWDYV
ncbi:pseudaminic acid synthase [Gracilibacillus marinus]|uniref:Pseudaminic acid synthase n=1 Tax=Gracilibacillus marinus TaxID=630535 RepID=A0ABV8VUW9_9BACI